MTGTSKVALVRTLLERHGTLWSDEVGVKLSRGTPSPLFRWLCTAVLLSARISHRVAVAASRALAGQGWTTAGRMAGSTWEARAKTLNESGYARYDERTSTMLGQVAELAQERYRGDLRRLRDAAERDPTRERELLMEFKGLGDVGVDIFFREVQLVWDELHPFADERALQAARKLDLGTDAKALARRVDRPEDFPRLVAALVRVDLEKGYDALRAQAAETE